MTTDVVELRFVPSPDGSEGNESRQVSLVGARSGGRLLVRRIVGAVITGVGVLLMLLIVFLYAFTPLAAGRDQHRLLSSLTGDPLHTFALTKGIVPAQGSAVALLRIPYLHITQAVVAGTSAADLEKGPGLMPGTVLPGEQGDAVIAGRRVTFGGPFRAINTLRPGAAIDITDGLGSFRYRVSSIRTALSGQRVVGGTRDNRLTLLTSNSPYSTSGLVVVDAKLVGKPFPSPKGLTGSIPSAQRGLSGEAGAGWKILIWSLLFVGGMALTGAALLRWRRPLPTYLLAVPVLIACGLFAVEAVALALPATL